MTSAIIPGMKEPAHLKEVSDELELKSKKLMESDVPHFFWILDDETRDVGYWGNLGDGEACEIIDWLVKQYGGEILDTVMDRIIEEEPSTVDTIQ